MDWIFLVKKARVERRGTGQGRSESKQKNTYKLVRNNYPIAFPSTKINQPNFIELYSDSVFRYEPFGIFPVFSYRIPKGNSVGKFGIIKLAGALYTHGDHTPARRLLSARIWGGRLLLARGNHGAFSERDIILPLFCDHHLIAKHKALLPTFEDEDDYNSELKIDVGVD